MNKSLLARSNLNESAEVHNTGYNAVIKSANLRVGSDKFNNAYSALALFCINAGNINSAVFLNVDFNIVFGLNFLNNLTALTDYITDFIRVNLKSIHLRSVL